MIFRKAKLDDVAAIVEIAVESVSQDPLPVKIDRAAMAEVVKLCLQPAHFAWVAEDDDGVIVASVVALVQTGFWFEKLQCSVLLFYTRKPAGGMPLLREFARWVKSRSGIKLAVISLEPNADPRLVKFFKKVGFDRESVQLTYARSAS